MTRRWKSLVANIELLPEATVEYYKLGSVVTFGRDSPLGGS